MGPDVAWLIRKAVRRSPFASCSSPFERWSPCQHSMSWPIAWMRNRALWTTAIRRPAFTTCSSNLVAASSRATVVTTQIPWQGFRKSKTPSVSTESGSCPSSQYPWWSELRLVNVPKKPASAPRIGLRRANGCPYRTRWVATRDGSSNPGTKRSSARTTSFFENNAFSGSSISPSL